MASGEEISLQVITRDSQKSSSHQLNSLSLSNGESARENSTSTTLQSTFPWSLLQLNNDRCEAGEDEQPDCSTIDFRTDFILKYVSKSNAEEDGRCCGLCSAVSRCRNAVTSCYTTVTSCCGQHNQYTEDRHYKVLKAYITNLRKEKHLRVFIEEDKENPGTLFFKISATFEALKDGAEELVLQKLVEPKFKDQFELYKHKVVYWHRQLLKTVFRRDLLSFTDPKDEKADRRGCFTLPYLKQYHDRYKDSADEVNFFTSSERIAIVSHFLENPTTKEGYTDAQDSEDDLQYWGLSEIIHEGYLNDAYPLHDNKFKKDAGKSDRQILADEWGNIRKLYKSQPFENIRDYFGEKIGLYFVWLGYYTYWLLPAVLVGLIVSICGLYSVSLDNNPIAQEICNETSRYFFFMCPPCDDVCDFWYYNSECLSAQFSLLFDNGGTIFFAVFISLWAILFVEFWNRRLTLLQFQWDTIDYTTYEKPLPQFLKHAKKYTLASRRTKLKCATDNEDVDASGNGGGTWNHIKNLFTFDRYYSLYNTISNYSDQIWDYHESRVTFWPRLFLTFSIVLTLVAALIGIIFSIIAYRIAVSTFTYRIVNQLYGGITAAGFVVSFSALALQVISIFVLNVIYSYVAKYLTGIEFHRTASDYETSYTLKMYLFYFVNFYSSIFYIAFFKGRFVGYPSNYNRIGLFSLEQCRGEGCQLELARQLFIIFTAKLVWENSKEFLTLIFRKYLKKFYKRYKVSRKSSLAYNVESSSISGIDESVDNADLVHKSTPVWKKDDILVPCDGNLSVGKHSLFSDYLDLVIQYGMVTIFVAAFPVAPLMALLNNIIEIRLNGYKFVKILRRPVPERTNDQAVWLSILDFISKLSVITNGLIIAFTSTYIDRMVYSATVEEGDSMATSCSIEPGDNCTEGFVTWATSSFTMTALLEPNGLADRTTDFPLLSVLRLPLYDANGEVVRRRSLINGKTEPVLYLPYLNFSCLSDNLPDFYYENFTESEFKSFYLGSRFQNLTIRTVRREADSDVLSGTGICFDQSIECRFRSQHEANGDHPLKYYRTLATKLAFVLFFENFIFIFGSIICFIIPDMPHSVKLERKLERKLTQNLYRGKQLF